MGRDTSPAIGSKKANPRGLAQVLDVYGAGERNRTLDLRITSALLYQLSYTGSLLASPPAAKSRMHMDEKGWPELSLKAVQARVRVGL